MEDSRVLYWFRQICAIPHGSGNTRALSDLCVRFAEERGLAVRQDAANNVVIVKEATCGYEGRPTVIVQAHLDMVTEKTPDCTLDFEREGLRLVTEGDWLRAEGTTLGADDGSGVAIALALLEADGLAHPRLEIVLTADEEIGMLGAAALDCSDLQGRRLLNLDSEVEGEFTVSCAGGMLVQCRFPAEWEKATRPAWRITVGGLKGGHSGGSIHHGRGNACVLMGRLLHHCGSHRLATLAAPGKDNAIAAACTAIVTTEEPAALKKAVEEYAAVLRREYAIADPGLTVTVEPAAAERVLERTRQENLEKFLLLAPNGVRAMSRALPGLVETSLNLGVIAAGETELCLTYCVRSSVTSRKMHLAEQLTVLAETLGGETSYSGEYPAWEYDPDSPLRRLATEVFREQYGAEPKTVGTHGGLECGIFCGKLHGPDVISYGPEIHAIHTPREKMSLSSLERVWRFTVALLEKC